MSLHDQGFVSQDVETISASKSTKLSIILFSSDVTCAPGCSTVLANILFWQPTAPVIKANHRARATLDSSALWQQPPAWSVLRDSVICVSPPPMTYRYTIDKDAKMPLFYTRLPSYMGINECLKNATSCIKFNSLPLAQQGMQWIHHPLCSGVIFTSITTTSRQRSCWHKQVVCFSNATPY